MALCAFIFVTVCMHGDDSARATQFILVFDGDDASFLLVLSVRTPTFMVFFLPWPVPGPGMDKNTTSTWNLQLGLKDSAVQLACQLANISSNEAVRCKN